MESRLSAWKCYNIAWSGSNVKFSKGGLARVFQLFQTIHDNYGKVPSFNSWRLRLKHFFATCPSPCIAQPSPLKQIDRRRYQDVIPESLAIELLVLQNKQISSIVFLPTSSAREQSDTSRKCLELGTGPCWFLPFLPNSMQGCRNFLGVCFCHFMRSLGVNYILMCR